MQEISLFYITHDDADGYHKGGAKWHRFVELERAKSYSSLSSAKGAVTHLKGAWRSDEWPEEGYKIVEKIYELKETKTHSYR